MKVQRVEWHSYQLVYEYDIPDDEITDKYNTLEVFKESIASDDEDFDEDVDVEAAKPRAKLKAKCMLGRAKLSQAKPSKVRPRQVKTQRCVRHVLRGAVQSICCTVLCFAVLSCAVV